MLLTARTRVVVGFACVNISAEISPVLRNEHFRNFKPYFEYYFRSCGPGKDFFFGALRARSHSQDTQQQAGFTFADARRSALPSVLFLVPHALPFY